MPQDGAQILSDVRQPVLTIVCEPCARRERHDVERLARQYGWDAKLTKVTAEMVEPNVSVFSDEPEVSAWVSPRAAEPIARAKAAFSR